MSRLTDNLEALERIGTLNRHHMGILENNLKEHNEEIRNAAVKEVSEELDFLRNWKAGVTNDFLKYDADSVEEIAEKARKQGIIEFASRLKHLIRINAKVSDRFVDCHYEVYESDIDEIAEELKGGKNE
jgi:hypothetical protein